MADYRVDLLNGSGRVVQQSNANCANDGEACALARRLLGFGERAEVWIEGRCAGRLSATSAAEVEMLGRTWAAPRPIRRKGTCDPLAVEQTMDDLLFNPIKHGAPS